jgi:hypothetical protein
MTYLPVNTATPFLPEQVVYSEDLSQLLIQLTNLFSQNSVATNIREISIYDLIPIVTGQQWYNLVTPQSKRFGFREVFSFTTIAAGATLTIAHGIPNLVQLTTVAGGVVTAVPDFRCLPYVSATSVTNQIEVNVDATNIYIINGSTAPAIASGAVVIEYLQN